MKKFNFLMTATLLMLLLFGGLEVVLADLPPTMPSSFYGEVQFASGDFSPQPGETLIEAYTDGGITPAASATISQPDTALIYAINVPGNTLNPQPTTVIFKIGDRIVAAASWVSGTNANLDIHPPFPGAGGPYVAVAGEEIVLSGSAEDLAGGLLTYVWDLDNDGFFDDGFGQNPAYSFTSGVHDIKLKATDSQGGEGVAQTQVIAITIGGLTGQVYDRTAKSVTINDVSPYTTVVTYDGIETAPTHAGTYAIVVTVQEGTTTVGTITGYNIIVDPRPMTVSATSHDKTYDGNADSSLLPTFPPESLINGDTANFSQSFDDKHVGDNKTLTPGGYVDDGNSGENYDITFVPVTTGSIRARPLTVTAIPDTKVYNGTLDSVGKPLLSEELVGGDTGIWSQTFDTVDAGTGKTLIPSGTITDGNGGENYAVVFINDLTGMITPRPIIVTADEKTKVYGSQDPQLTFTHSDDLIAGDNFIGELTRESGEDIGVYIISQNTLTLGSNYTITYIPANFTITEVKHVIILEAGWNLVSFNLHPLSSAPQDVLSSIDGSYDLVYAWDASGLHSGSGNWMKYDPAMGTINSLETLDPTMGFWIHMTTADTLTVAGIFQTNTTVNLVDEVGGWNLVSFPSAGSVSMPTALEGNGVSASDYSMVYTYHAADVADHWKLYDTDAPGFANDLVNLDPGFGYWVYVLADPVWTVNYQIN